MKEKSIEFYKIQEIWMNIIQPQLDYILRCFWEGRKSPDLNMIILNHRVTGAGGFVSCPFPLGGLPWLWFCYFWKQKNMEKSLLQVRIKTFPLLHANFSHTGKPKLLPGFKTNLSLLKPHCQLCGFLSELFNSMQLFYSQ